MELISQKRIYDTFISVKNIMKLLRGIKMLLALPMNMQFK